VYDHRRGYGIGTYHSCIIFLLLIVTFIPSANAADAMFRANAEHTGVYEDGGIVQNNTELWRLKIGGYVRSSPAVSNGIVFIGSADYKLHAIDAMTRKEKWRFDTGGAVHSSPAVSNGIVYVGGDKHLYAIDAVTGTEKWRFPTGDAVSSSPTVSNGIIFVGSSNHNLYAIDAVTGSLKWLFAMGDNVFSSPAISNGVIYAGSDDKNLYAINATTGKEEWRFKTGSYVRSSPAVSNGVAYIGSYDGNLYAIDAVTGKQKWEFTIGRNADPYLAGNDGLVYRPIGETYEWRFIPEIGSSPAVSNGVVYAGSTYDYPSHFLYAIDAVTGKEKWRFERGYEFYSSPVISNGIIYFGSDSALFAVDEITGVERWRFITGEGVWSSPAVSNGIVYFGSLDGNVYAVGGVPTSLEPMTMITPTPATIRAVETTQSIAVSNPRIQSTPQPTLLSKSGNSTPVTKTTDLTTQRIQSVYWIVVLIFSIGILYEGWKAVKPRK